MTFQEIPYYRIDFDEFKSRYNFHINRLIKASSYEEFFNQLLELDFLESLFLSYSVVSEARNTANTFDVDYQKEEQYLNTVKPEFFSLKQRKNKLILESIYKEPLKKIVGQEFFNQIELTTRTINQEIQPLMVKENEFSQKFSELISQISIEYEGQKYSANELLKAGACRNREIRKKYNYLLEKAYLDKAEDFDYLFDQMLKIRHRIALNISFENYTDYCYCLRVRTGYGRVEIHEFTHNVETHLVPFINNFMNIKKTQLGYDKLYNFDENYLFDHSIEINSDLKEAFGKIFSKLSPETKVFYDELMKCEFYDLDLRKGKIMGGYSNYLPIARFPYIFESYNETPAAVEVFAHECGHGLNSFMHRGDILMLDKDYSSDISEVHSMSMEFFIWPHLDYIIEKKDLKYYKLNQIIKSLVLISYGTAINEFQTIVYDNHNFSINERLEIWKSLERRFVPWRNYEESLFSDQGRSWQKQMHVMKWPFYYIDYVLAQIMALQFWIEDEKNHEKAWQKYLKFIDCSGKYSFSSLIKETGLQSPFEKETLKYLIEELKIKLLEIERS